MENLKSFLFTAILLLLCPQAFTQVDSTATDTVTTVTDTVAPPAQDTTTVTDLPPGAKPTVISFLKKHWSDILLWFVPLLWFIVRLTPTKKDDDIIKIILSWLDALVPNRKAGGGVHATYTDARTAPKMAFVPKKQ